MNPALIAGAIQGIGSLVGGRAKKRAAKKLAADIDAAASDVIQQTKNDAQQALALARDDERRLKEATGYDLGKLRDDAIKAGFNPLTVLQATGAAGYDGRGAVVTSPFVAEAPAWEARMNAKLSAGGAVVDTSGYVGQAISAAGSGYFDQRNADAQLETEKLRTQLMQAEFQNIAGGSAGSGYTPFGAPVRGVTASPVTAFGGSGVTSDGLPAGEPPMQVQPASSEFMWKKVRTGIPGYDVWVYNDEASESEVASTLSLGTVPIQMFGQWVKPYLTDENGVGWGRRAARAISDAWASGTSVSDAPFAGKMPWQEQVAAGTPFSLGR